MVLLGVLVGALLRVIFEGRLGRLDVSGAEDAPLDGSRSLYGTF